MAETLIHEADQSPRSALARGPAALALLLVAATGLLPYWTLTPYDPYAGVESGIGDLEEWFFASSGSSRVLLFGVAGWLLYRRRQRLLEASCAPARWDMALPFLLAVISLHLWSDFVGAPDLTVASLILVLMGGGPSSAGRRARRTGDGRAARHPHLGKLGSRSCRGASARFAALMRESLVAFEGP